MDILQQLAQALQRATQPAAVAPQRSAIERMERYRPVDFLRRKEDEPFIRELAREDQVNAGANALHN